MILERNIYTQAKKVIPKESGETIFFIGITETSHEVFFYSEMDGAYIQCYELQQKDEYEMENVFERIVQFIKASNQYVPTKYNLFTVKINKRKVTINVEYYNKNEKIYDLKKKWKDKNIPITMDDMFTFYDVTDEF